MDTNQVSLNRRISLELLPKPLLPGPPPFVIIIIKGILNRNNIRRKNIQKQKRKIKFEKEKEKNKVKVTANGVGKRPPYHKWGYNSEGDKMRDPNSQRPHNKRY